MGDGLTLTNALGQRIMKSGASVTVFVYDEAGHLIGEYDGSGNLIEETVWMGNTPVATLQTNGSGVSVYYIHADHLNTPRRISRPSDNTIVWRWDSEPFGTAGANQDPDGNGVLFTYNLRFPGQYFDSETGLAYNYYRDYDPGTGRYVESDPIGLHGGINTYAYVKQMPIRFTDPLGLVDINLFPPSSPLYNYANLTPSPPDTITVAGHSNPFDIENAAGQRLSPSDLAQLITSNPAWRPGMKVQLLACNTGAFLGMKLNFAQRLAQILQTIVQGANNFVWFNSDGSYDIAGVNAPGIDWSNYTHEAGSSGENPNDRGWLPSYGPQITLQNATSIP